MVGFCFGGGMTWLVATKAPDLKAAVPYYGPNPPLEGVPNIKAAVHAMYGENDQRINAGIPAIEDAMKRNNKVFEKMIYPGASHTFHNDTGRNYNPVAAEDAWKRTLDWFARVRQGWLSARRTPELDVLASPEQSFGDFRPERRIGRCRLRSRRFRGAAERLGRAGLMTSIRVWRIHTLQRLLDACDWQCYTFSPRIRWIHAENERLGIDPLRMTLFPIMSIISNGFRGSRRSGRSGQGKASHLVKARTASAAPLSPGAVTAIRAARERRPLRRGWGRKPVSRSG